MKLANAMNEATTTTLTGRAISKRHWNPLRVVTAVIVTLLIIPVGVVALGSGSGLIPLPYEMFVLAGRMPILFPAHMLTSAMALLLLPAVVLVRHRPDIHRMLGRLVGAFVVAGGLTALPVALFSESSGVARAGFFMQGIVWIALFVRGMMAIRSHDRRTHAFYMIAMTAVTTGAVWFRVITGGAIALQLPFTPVYAAAAWLGWIIPLTIVVAFPRIYDGLLPRSPVPSPQRA